MSFKLERAGGSSGQALCPRPQEHPTQAAKEGALKPSGTQPATPLSRRPQDQSSLWAHRSCLVTRKQEVGTAGLNGRSHLMSQSPRL